MTPQPPEPVKGMARTLGVLVALRTAARSLLGRRRAEEPPETKPDEVPDRGPDVDPSERTVPANPRAELLVAALLALGGLGGAGFLAVYVVDDHNTQLLGLALGLGLAFLAAAAIIAGKAVVPQETHVEERDPLLEEEEAEEVVEMVASGTEGVSRRGLLIGAGGVAGAGMVAALATPLASLGPTLNGIHATQWHKGRRLVDETGKPYLASDIEIGTFYTALPEHGDPEKLNAPLIMVRLPADFLHLPAARKSWAPEGIVAYSKICPHAGCTISLYRYPTYAASAPAGSRDPAFVCPCHYSTFLPGEGGRLAFGPAGRALPQLPLMIDSQGYVRAAGPFYEDIGPSWWNVHRGQS